MSIQAVVTLHTLRCITESDRAGSNHSEPYIWTFMASVSNNSFATTPTAALLSDSRRIRKNEMRAGESVSMDFPGQTLSATFEDDQSDRQLILVVALLEADDAPEGAIQAGYQAFLDELKLRLGHNILALKTATEDEKNEIIAQIQRQVSEKATSAIKGALTTGQKIKVKLGFLNMDDFMASQTRHFTDLTPQDFTLRFEGTSGDPKVTNQAVVVLFPITYEIDGRVSVSEITVDACQANVDAVAAAEAKIRGLHLQVQSLQQQLQTATPQQKSGIIALIRRINEQDIPAAKQALEGAKRMLQRCRVMGSVLGDLDTHGGLVVG